jgi:RNA polymerase primary sigma factor
VSEFIHPALKELADQQVRYTPPAKRQEQLVRAEQLLGDIDAAKRYPYQFVCFRITEFRSDAYPELLIPGPDLRHDLNLFLDRLDRSLPAVPIEQAVEPMLTLEQISRQLNVSTKTINRWQKRGLLGSRSQPVVCDGRRQRGYPRSAVERLVAAHQTVVRRGSRFSHLTEAEKEEILRRARRLSHSGGSLTEVSRRIARHLGRSTEAVRYTIKNFDRAHPDQALFPTVTGPLDGDAKRVIYNSYRRGIPVTTLAKRYGRTRTSVYRAINEVKAEKLLAQPTDYIYNETFDDPANEAVYSADMPNVEAFNAQRRSMKPPKDVPAELASLYEWPLLNKAQEQHLFRKLNFLKHQLKRLKADIDPARARRHHIEAVEELQGRIAAVKELLVKCNMRLVASIAKQHSASGENLFELISDGNMSLLRAVEKFDYARGFKFSTYATWAIRKNFARSIPDEKHHRERYLTGHEELFETKPDTRSDEQEMLSSVEQAAHKVNRLLEYLDPREREIVRMRAGLDGSEPRTLEDIGKVMGITKERVRQLNVRTMKKLRELAVEKKFDM